MLQLVTQSREHAEISLAGAIYFKNFVKRHWTTSTYHDVTVEISESDRSAIRTHLLSLMLNSSTTVKRVLSEALSLIGAADFPAKWPTLLPVCLYSIIGVKCRN